ncbi:MAG: ABC transporter permease subunit, partial [Clostridia bacterium]
MLNIDRIAKPRKKKVRWQLWLLLSPSLVYLLIFCYLPMLGIIIAFKDYSPSLGLAGIFTSEWVGFKHFVNFFTYPSFWSILKNTLVLSLYALVVNTIVPIVLALVINEVHNKVFKNIFQTISYAPYFVSLVVLVGICGSFLQGPNSVFNVIGGFFGLPPKNILSEQSLFSTVYTLSGLWQGLGWWTIIYVGTLSNVDRTLHEAAAIDGASRFRRIISINIPA